MEPKYWRNQIQHNKHTRTEWPNLTHKNLEQTHKIKNCRAQYSTYRAVLIILSFSLQTHSSCAVWRREGSSDECIWSVSSLYLKSGWLHILMSLYTALSGSMIAQICPLSSSCCSGFVAGNPLSARLLSTSLLTCSDTPAMASGSLLQTNDKLIQYW